MNTSIVRTPLEGEKGGPTPELSSDFRPKALVPPQIAFIYSHTQMHTYLVNPTRVIPSLYLSLPLTTHRL